MGNKEQEKKIQRLIGFTTYEKKGLGALLVLIIFSPLVFTQIYSGISFIDTGQIGDTIGGITAPFVNLLAAYLVYKSFTAQIKANIQQREDFEKQYKAVLKEQSYNTFNNLYNLSVASYEKNSRIGKLSCISHIMRGVCEFTDKTRFYYSNGKKLEKLPSDIEIKMQINMELKDPIQTMIRNMRTIHTLQVALKKAEIDKSLKRFYHSQIEDILYDMDLWILLNPAMTNKIEEHKVLNTTQKALYEQSKELAKLLKSGYQVRSQLG